MVPLVRGQPSINLPRVAEFCASGVTLTSTHHGAFLFSPGRRIPALDPFSRHSRARDFHAYSHHLQGQASRRLAALQGSWQLDGRELHVLDRPADSDVRRDFEGS